MLGYSPGDEGGKGGEEGGGRGGGWEGRGGRWRQGREITRTSSQPIMIEKLLRPH